MAKFQIQHYVKCSKTDKYGYIVLDYDISPTLKIGGGKSVRITNKHELNQCDFFEREGDEREDGEKCYSICSCDF